MHRVLSLLVAILILALYGCGPKVNTLPHSQAPTITPDADSAVVYIARESRSFGGGGNFPILEDDKPIGVLSNGSYFIHKTTPGKHFYYSNWPAPESGIIMGVSIDMEAGKTYYLETWVDTVRLDTGLRFHQITEVAAQKLLSKMRYSLPQ